MAGRFKAPLIVSVVFVAIGGLVALICAGLIERPPDLSEADLLLTQAKQSLDRREFVTAEEFARKAIDQGTELAVDAWIIAGESIVQQKRFEDAVECFLEVIKVSDKPDDRALAHALAADILALQLHQLGRAEKHYRRALEIKPDQDNARNGLLNLLVAEGRRRSAETLLMDLVRSGQSTEQHLFLLGNAEWVIETISFKIRSGPRTMRRDDFLRLARQAMPDDPVPAIGLARLAESGNRDQDAIALLETVVAGDPRQDEAWGLLGVLLARGGDAGAFLDWHRRLPGQADQDPRTWLARASWARGRRQDKVAARCYWECLRRDPNQLAANLQLAQVLTRLGRDSESVPFRQRARQLSELVTLLKGLAGNPRYGDAGTGNRLRRVVELNAQLGRAWEATAWSLFALKNNPTLDWPQEQLKQLRPFIARPGDPRTVDTFNPVTQHDLSSLPTPEWTDAAAVAGEDPGSDRNGTGPISFRDDARAVGLDFRYYSDATDPIQQSRLPETNGGGIGVVDFDHDGWPDLYLPQGNHQPVDRRDPLARPTARPPAVPPRDRLFRNTGTGRFVDVTVEAGIDQTGYGQGVAVGDINGDGFADIHVANIGGNRLLINNGDGTYSDETKAAGIAGDHWSVSSLLADLDGDALADLYVVNYLAGENLFLTACPPGSSTPHPCGPGDFAAAQDRLFLNTGDGGFRDVTATSGIVHSGGKGLGVVAADFNGSGRLDLFVVNDTRPNFLFQNPADGKPGQLSLRETAARTGLAFSDEGEPESCMGIAVGDADGDGTLDLFVTNYAGQSNTLYSLQKTAANGSGSHFLDRTRNAGLFSEGFPLVGWGTEFLDGDLDGDLDLLVTNGHLPGHVRDGEQLAMPPLCFRNSGRGRFATVSADQLGSYFAVDHIGRGLARIDWNRDGREDAVITHLDAPLALLTNTTAKVGHHLVLRLVGTRSARDAIGTTVTAVAGGRTWTGQLTAGDGFLVSNQHQLVIGLGATSTLDSISIRWPSGHQQQLARIDADRTLVIVEGRGGFAIDNRPPPPIVTRQRVRQ